MAEDTPFDKNSPFFVPSPTTTASDVFRIVEEVREKKQLLDSQLLAMLPNLVASHVIAICQSTAAVEGRSLNHKMDSAQLYARLPLRVRTEILGWREAEAQDACRRILNPLGEKVQGILTHLGFTCSVTSVLCLDITISW